MAAKLLMLGELKLAGSHIPTQRSIYEPVLEELAGAGLEFAESVKPVE